MAEKNSDARSGPAVLARNLMHLKMLVMTVDKLNMLPLTAAA